MDEETKDRGQDEGGGSEDGRDTLEDLTKGRPLLVKLLDNPDVVQKEPGTWIYQEGDEVHGFAYVVQGRVKVFAAGEDLDMDVKSGEPLGVDEFLIRDESPRYTKAAQAVEPTFLLWLDEGGLRRIADLDKGAIKALLKVKARSERRLAEANGRLKTEKARLETAVAQLGTRVSQLGTALGQTQDALAAKERLSSFPPRPSKAPPPPPPRKGGSSYEELQARLRTERETNQNLVRLMQRSDKELAALLADLRQVIEKNPALQKSEAFKGFLGRLEAAVTRRANIEIALKPT